MTTEELVNNLRTYNEWRRGGDDPQPSPKDIGEWIDEACEKLEESEQELYDIRVNLGDDAEGHTTLYAVCALQNERDDLYFKLQDAKQSLEVALEELARFNNKN